MPAFARRPKFSVMNMASLCTCVSANPRLPKRPAAGGVKALADAEREALGAGGEAGDLVDGGAGDVGVLIPGDLGGVRTGDLGGVLNTARTIRAPQPIGCGNGSYERFSTCQPGTTGSSATASRCHRGIEVVGGDTKTLLEV